MILALILSMWTVNLDMECVTFVERPPEVRQGIMQEDLLLLDVAVVQGYGRRLLGVWTFMGSDPGDRMEFDTEVYADNVPVVLRSLHKPHANDYDAWRYYPNYNINPRPVDTIVLVAAANVTGENKTTPREEGSKTARPHWGVWLIWECDPMKEANGNTKDH